MDQQDHDDYYVKRAASSRDLAQRAAAPNIAAIHNFLATHYDALALQPERKIDIVLVSNQAA